MVEILSFGLDLDWHAGRIKLDTGREHSVGLNRGTFDGKYGYWARRDQFEDYRRLVAIERHDSAKDHIVRLADSTHSVLCCRNRLGVENIHSARALVDTMTRHFLTLSDNTSKSVPNINP